MLDAQGLIALFKAEPAAMQVELLIRAGDAKICTLNLAEVLDILVRRDGFSENEIRGLVDPLLQKEVQALPVTTELAFSAAMLRSRHYHRRDRPLSLADCVALAASLDVGRLATADALLAQIAREEGVEVAGLPNALGIVP